MARFTVLLGCLVACIGALLFLLSHDYIPGANYLGSAISTAGALVAIVGNTQDPSKNGLNKLTKTGWAMLYVIVFGCTISIYNAATKHEIAQWKADKNCQYVGKAIMKILVPYRAMYYIWSAENGFGFPSEIVYDVYSNASFIDHLENFDLSEVPDFKDIPPEEIFDIQQSNVDIGGPWYMIIQKNTRKGIDELANVKYLYGDILTLEDLQLIDRIIQNPFLEPLKSLEAQVLRGDSVSVPGMSWFINDVKELDHRYDFSQCLQKGIF